MTDRSVLPLSRRATLGTMFAFSLAGSATAGSANAVSWVSCAAPGAALDTIYEYDPAGKPIEWDYPSGTASRGG